MKHLSLFLVCIFSAGPLSILRAAQCSYTLSPTASARPADAGSGIFSVNTGSSCAWTATTTNAWLHTTNHATGSNIVIYSVDANASLSSRTGIITVASQSFTITQAGAPLTLAAALNSSNLVWQTASNYPWLPTNNVNHDGVASATSGNQFVPNSTSWLQTTVVGPGTIGFWWKVDSDITPPPPSAPLSYDTFEFLINGQQMDQIMGQVDWNYRAFSLPAGTNTITWQYVKDPQYNSGYDRAWLDQVTWSPGQPIALQDALGTCSIQWTTGGSDVTPWTGPALGWAGQTNVTHDGLSAAQSGTIYLNQETWMQTVVSGVSNVSFWWKVSSQSNYDYLEFYTNDVLVSRISGEVNWQSNFFKLAPGTTTLKWRYSMTNGIYAAQGQDAAWVDQVTFSPNDTTPPVVTLLGSTPMTVECHAGFVDPGATAQDACAGTVAIVTNGTVNPNSPGLYTLTYIATDPSGNSATNTRSVTVVDTTPPTVLFSFTNLTLAVGSNCHASLPDLTGTNYFVASDNCSSVTVTQSPAAGSSLPLGTNLIVLTAVDASGNSTSRTNPVLVVDATPPSLICPSNLVVNTSPGQCGATNVLLGVPALTDNCGDAAVTNDAPAFFPVGTNLVTWTAVDTHGNVTNSSQLVVILDSELPIITAPTALTLSAPPGTNVVSDFHLGTPVTSDNCGIASLTNDAPGTLALGTNIITWTVMDVHGNSAAATQLVVVNPAPRLPHSATALASGPDGTVTVTFLGQAHVQYIVQVSSNLIDWVCLQTNTAGDDGTWTVLDGTAPGCPSRFYRSWQPW